MARSTPERSTVSGVLSSWLASAVKRRRAAEGEEQRRDELLGAEQGGTDVGAHEQRAELRAGLGERAHAVVQRGPVGLDVNRPLRQPVGAGAGDDLPQPLELGERECPRVRRCEQHATLRVRDEQVVGNGLERRRHVLGEHRPPQRVEGDDEPAGAVHAGQNGGGEIGLGADPAVEVLEGALAARDVQNDRERRERGRERRGVPGREADADGGHVRPARRTPRRAPCG
ncbi:MAG: hypothetical protein DMD74_09810 [Gemmatimonadetes bacterium]|nr:MAG: hypothetical protein DMD74_09810 [Gemmatimonadota bacterium]